MARAARTAVITGSGRNIGRGCAQELARAGFNIVVNGARNRKDCERVADEVRAIGPDALIAMADVGDQAACRGLADAALKAFGRVDAFVNNAALREARPFLELTDDEIKRVMDVNCNAAIWLSRAFLPAMIENGWGRIITFTGMNSLRGTGGRPHITMSKHAGWGLMKALAREFGPKGVTANTISPGTFPDEDDDVATDANLQRLLAQIPVGRLGQPSDISGLVGLLCSEQGGFINGQMIQVNGGVET